MGDTKPIYVDHDELTVLLTALATVPCPSQTEEALLEKLRWEELYWNQGR